MSGTKPPTTLDALAKIWEDSMKSPAAPKIVTFDVPDKIKLDEHFSLEKAERDGETIHRLKGPLQDLAGALNAIKLAGTMGLNIEKRRFSDGDRYVATPESLKLFAAGDHNPHNAGKLTLSLPRQGIHVNDPSFKK